MVEHLTFNQVVRGSNPRCFTGTSRCLFLFFSVICGYGGIGRRARFRFWCLRRAGSSPVIRSTPKCWNPYFIMGSGTFLFAKIEKWGKKGANYKIFIRAIFSSSFSFNLSVTCRYISFVTLLFSCPRRLDIVSMLTPFSRSREA